MAAKTEAFYDIVHGHPSQSNIAEFFCRELSRYCKKAESWTKSWSTGFSETELLGRLAVCR